MIKVLVKKLDFLGGDIKLLYKENEGPKSVFGGLITIFLGFIVSIMIFEFGQDFFNRTNPNFYMQEVNPVEYKRFNITNQNLPISFRFESNDAALLDPNQKNFYFDIFHFRYKRNSEGIMEKLDELKLK